MAEKIIAFFTEHVSNIYLLGILISMIPMIELKGAIPAIYALLLKAGKDGATAIFTAFGLSFVGSGLVAPVLLGLLLPTLAWLKKTRLFRPLAEWVERHFNKKSNDFEQKSLENAEGAELSARQKRAEGLRYWGLFAFTAIPLPLTGVWSASAIAAFLRMDYKKSLFYIELGNFVAGIAVALVSYFIGDVLL